MADLQQDTEKYVELRNINKTYGTFKASNNINLGIGKGKLIALLGPVSYTHLTLPTKLEV